MVAGVRKPATPVVVALVLGSCGGGASPTPLPTPTPVMTSTPAPQPTPTPAPDPCTLGLCEDPTTNSAPPVRVILRIFQIFDSHGTWILPNPDPFKQVVKEPIPVGYLIRFDLTGKDADGNTTNGQKNVDFVISDPTMVDVALSGDFQRKMRILKPGKWELYGVLDGVASNSLGFTFCDPNADPACHYP